MNLKKMIRETNGYTETRDMCFSVQCKLIINQISIISDTTRIDCTVMYILCYYYKICYFPNDSM